MTTLCDKNLIVAISEKPLDILSTLNFIATPLHGGTAIFQGTIRAYNNNRQVIGVTYDIYEQLALKTFMDFYHEIARTWGDSLKVAISHYKGRLNVGEMSVLIAVSAVHREEAFKATRYIIEEIKHKSPIWKQEHYVDGDSEWVKGHALCQACPAKR